MTAETVTMQRLKELMSKKDKLESDIKEFTDVLESQGNVGMEGPLVDAEGFPRNDIDVYTVRHARHQIICLRNDYKALMKEIETMLHKVHAEARERKEQQMEVDASNMTIGQNSSSNKTEFAKVDRVDPGSPAAACGLEVGDELVQFGSVSSDNFQDLQTIGSLVQHSKDRPLSVTVQRKGVEILLTLTPKAWSGRGLLGCNIIPVKK